MYEIGKAAIKFMSEIFKIVLTGPESSGKTQMAAALAAALGVAYVPEFARHYLSHLGRPYTQADLKNIGRGQRAWEDWYAAAGLSAQMEKNEQIPSENSLANNLPEAFKKRCLVLDTDWTVLHIWENYGYPETTVREWQQGYGATRLGDLYLLCAPDFAWEPDPLREHPEAREELFALYEALLQSQNATFLVLRGTLGERLQTALEVLGGLTSFFEV